MRKLIVLCGVLAGCASEPSYPEMLFALGQAPTVEVCYVAVAGRSPQARAAASEELGRRGSTCQAEMPLVMARLQNDQAKRAAFMQWQAQQQQANITTQQNNAKLFQGVAPQPTPAPPQTAVVCSSQVVGGQLQTICQ